MLANENVPAPSVRALRDNGWDVVSVAEKSFGIPDEEVIELANAENRLIITLDKDYGELVFRRGFRTRVGVLYLRFRPKTPREIAEYITRLIERGVELEGRFTVADRDRVRQRVLRIV